MMASAPAVSAATSLSSSRVEVGVVGRGADIGVDLGAEAFADAADLLRQVVAVGGDNDLAGRHERHKRLRGNAFLLRDHLHLRGDLARASRFYLIHGAFFSSQSVG